MKDFFKNLELPFHVVKRSTIPVWKSMLFRVIAVVAALLLCSILAVFMIDASPIKFITTMFDGAFGSGRRIWKFAMDTCVLLCIALAITPAFKMRFWNIGAEGQTLIGALAAVAVIIHGKGLPNWFLLILMFIAAVLVGAVWGGIPAVCKAIWGTNETLFTLMMNYVATGLVSYYLLLWTPSGSSVLGRLDQGYLPVLGHEYLLLILLVLALTAAVYVYQKYTKQGYEISVVGESENTANYIGINVKKVIIRTMLISGAICGFAGFLIVGALDHSVAVTSVGGRGFTAIMVSWLAKFNPLIMIGTSAFITFLKQGAAQVTSTFNVDSAFPDVVVGIVLFFIIGCEFFIGYQLKFKLNEKAKEELNKKEGGYLK
jgi:simple sugar transport system permease protein